jgi:hypothetical protein
MASTVSRPRPGSAKTLSVTTAPPMSSAKPIPMMVTTGSEAFFSAWRTSTRRGASPLANAVRM